MRRRWTTINMITKNIDNLVKITFSKVFICFVLQVNWLVNLKVLLDNNQSVPGSLNSQLRGWLHVPMSNHLIILLLIGSNWESKMKNVN